MRGMKSYTTLNDYYRTLFGEKTFKVPIVMELLLEGAVLFVQFLALGMPS